ncbi:MULTISPECIES: GerMN domain-containing protein [Clostridium]|uniref:GerMN domain-containing protein n=2 Tax=Clostridium TaxID=1485 RepID=A0A7X5PCB5_CLOSG|nr:MULTISPECIES: GerMN domain-containing protein [Clostridium]AJD31431.1 sporulation and spore germination family protein [Clostridium botulinum Prevot_594]AVP61591.1 sporulation/spore germination protein [Clostridium botulinum]AKC64420.1 spore germination protein [Clostridium sporogenes]AKJ91537.1 sporulation/spore germination protein [Clostridium sporogenes]AVP65575.1 sporulation/spore germination protein [Clostridium botulinum]
MKKSIKLAFCSSLIISSVFFISCEKKDSISINNKDKIKNITLHNEKNNLVDLNLYFDSTNSSNNAEITKEERIIKKDELLGQFIIGELIKGPSVNNSLKPIFPKETRLLSFSIKNNIAYVNLSSEAYYSMTADKEEAYLKSIIWSLTELPSIKKVKLFIENKDISSLSKNFKFDEPIGRDDISKMNKKNNKNK